MLLVALGVCRAAATRTDASTSGEVTCATLREGAIVRREGLGRDGRLRVGLVADTRGADAETLAAVRRFAARFREEKVDLVAALGGLGQAADEIAEVAGALAESGAPVAALPGDREPEEAFHDGLDRARAGGREVIDLQRARILDGAEHGWGSERGERGTHPRAGSQSNQGALIDTPGEVDVVALPGYPFRSYLADPRCRYVDKDVDELAAAATRLGAQPRLLLAHTPPRGSGPDAIDFARGDVNAGDPAVARLFARGFRFGAFAHVDEAGGRATDGERPVPEGVWADRLQVNPGAARARAAILEVAGAKARYRVLR